VRVKISEVRAADQTAAIRTAMDAVRLDDVFNRTYAAPRLANAHGVVTAVEYADEVQYALVDERGDEQYERSRAYRVGDEGTWVSDTEP
jgi:hypothetical protein